MAQKAAKQQAARNSAILKRLHLISLSLNSIFIVLRFFLFRSTCTRSTYLLYFILSAPAFAIECWFESIGRPTHLPNRELEKSGDDLEAKGLTEYMFDVLYWTWGNVAVASIFGDRAWWLWLGIPVYSVYLAYTTFGSVRNGIGGLANRGGGSDGSGGDTSNRQKKMEKRGGQKMQYR